jgi:hypothetical protein
LEEADLSFALLWRSNGGSPSRGDAASLAMIRVPNSANAWSPVGNEDGKVQPWDGAERLRKTIDSLPAGQLRDQAFDRIEVLDCANPDKTLASCNPSVPPTPEAAEWRKRLEDARATDDQAYAEALASELESMVCSSDEQATYVVRGAGFQERLSAAGSAASDVVAKLANKESQDCPVAASLTDADREKLREIKRKAAE